MITRRAQRIWIAVIFLCAALQLYIVREWLAGLLMVAAVLGGMALLAAAGLALHAVWQRGLEVLGEGVTRLNKWSRRGAAPESLAEVHSAADVQRLPGDGGRLARAEE